MRTVGCVRPRVCAPDPWHMASHVFKVIPGLRRLSECRVQVTHTHFSHALPLPVGDRNPGVLAEIDTDGRTGSCRHGFWHSDTFVALGVRDDDADFFGVFVVYEFLIDTDMLQGLMVQFHHHSTLIVGHAEAIITVLSPRCQVSIGDVCATNVRLHLIFFERIAELSKGFGFRACTVNHVTNTLLLPFPTKARVIVATTQPQGWVLARLHVLSVAWTDIEPVFLAQFITDRCPPFHECVLIQAHLVMRLAIRIADDDVIMDMVPINVRGNHILVGSIVRDSVGEFHSQPMRRDRVNIVFGVKGLDHVTS